MKSYFNLRNVSRALRTIIDQQAPPCTSILVRCGEDRMKVYLNGSLVAEYFDRTESHLQLGLIEKRHLNILELLLRNPKLRLESFQFNTHSWFRVCGIRPPNHKKRFFDLLNSLHHKIHVEKCVMKVDNKKDVIKVLKCFKPGTLKELEIDAGLSRMKVNEVVTMNQWKLAKHLKIFTFELPSIDNFFHFSTFELGISAITVEDVVKLCENLLKSNTFEHCKVGIQEKSEWETIRRVLNLQPTASPEVYSIPNTNLVIQFDRWNLNWLKIYKS